MFADYIPTVVPLQRVDEEVGQGCSQMGAHGKTADLLVFFPSKHNFTRLTKWCFGNGSSSSTMELVTLSTLDCSVCGYIREEGFYIKTCQLFISASGTLKMSDEVSGILQVGITDDS